MKEFDFWASLEFRVCAEMSGIEECREKGLWCDGFIPEDYHLGLSGCYVTGRAWICFGQDQQPWEYRFDLPKGTRDLSSMDWESLIPPANVTKWMSIDYETQ